MPIYEYRCRECRQLNQVFIRSSSAAVAPKCARCGSDRLDKAVSRFSVVQSDEARLERMADPSFLGDVDEDDPKSVAKWARRLGSEMGEDLGPEFDEVIDQVESGQMDDMPGMGEDAGTGDGLDDLGVTP